MTTNDVIAEGKLIAISPYGKQKKITLFCKSQSGKNVYPQFICKEIDEKLLQEYVHVEGYVQNRPVYRGSERVYQTSFTLTYIEKCRTAKNGLAACSNRINIYLQGIITSFRQVNDWITMTVDVGKNKGHMPVRVQMFKDAAKGVLDTTSPIKCTCELLTPTKIINGKRNAYRNIIVTEICN